MPAVVLANAANIADVSGATINPAQEDGNLASIKTNTDKLDVNLSTIASQATLASILTELQAKTEPADTQLVDVIDRAVRDLGKVDIAAFDVALPVGDNNIGRVKITDGTDVADLITAGGANRLQVEAFIAAGGASQDVHPVDANGLDLDVEDGVATPVNTRSLLIAGKDESGFTRVPTVTEDPQDGKNRVEITGKVSVSTPDAPPSSTPRTVEANSPLSIGSRQTTNYVIPNGVTFTLLSVTAGSEGDPNERGNKVEVSYVDAASVVHLIERLYISSQTIQVYPNTDRARDETIMVGDGITTQLRIIRYRLGGGTTECDVIVRGFEQ